VSTLSKVQVVWENFIGGPGVNTFYVEDDTPDLGDFKGLYAAIGAGIPTEVNLSFPTSGSTVDSVTGNLVGAWTADNPGDEGATGGGNYAAGTGIAIAWGTGAVVGNKRVLGHTYIVPTVSAVFTADGLLEDGYHATVVTAAQALIDALAGSLVVWHRPVSHLGGSAHQVVSAAVSRVPANLRNRKR